jgi:hypothetical protein
LKRLGIDLVLRFFLLLFFIRTIKIHKFLPPKATTKGIFFYENLIYCLKFQYFFCRFSAIVRDSGNGFLIAF